MENDAFKRFMGMETRLIEISKWIAGERLGRDPGEEYIMKWIEEHSIELREAWENSRCRTCDNDCPQKMKSYCEDYKPGANNSVG